MTSIWLKGDALWERMNRAAGKIRERLERVSAALNSAGVPFAVSGGNAVRVWVAQAEDATARTTRGVDIQLRRSDLPAARAALEAAGFVYRHAGGIDMFLDGPDAKAREAVHLLYAGEKVREEYATAAPTLDETTEVDGTPVITLDTLVRMKLTSFRDKDRMHLRDLIDASWWNRLPPELACRPQELLDNPDG
ncbi:hypothetical protein GC176_12590 [bacterium]|nr:hypothetical protein [bacterium]